LLAGDASFRNAVPIRRAVITGHKGGTGTVADQKSINDRVEQLKKQLKLFLLPFIGDTAAACKLVVELRVPRRTRTRARAHASRSELNPVNPVRAAERPAESSLREAASISSLCHPWGQPCAIPVLWSPRSDRSYPW
jgi:hypothetical protein